MHRRTRRRLAISALCICVAGIALDASRRAADDSNEFILAEAPRHKQSMSVVAEPAADLSHVDSVSQDSDSDPFAPRSWDAPVAQVVAPSPPVAESIVIPQPATPLAATAPSLPFAFMGRFNDGVGEMVYLSRGEESWTVKGGELLDPIYKVVAVTPQQVVFEHVPTGTQQTLPIPEPDK